MDQHQPPNNAKSPEPAATTAMPKPPASISRQTSSDKGPCCSASCLRFCCYCFFVILLTIILIFAIIVTRFKPSLPTIDIIKFEPVKFQVDSDSILETKFVLTIKADNSNTQFSFTYEEGSSIQMSYNNTAISSGHLPEFRQDPGNVFVFKVVMEGENKYEGDLKEVSAKRQSSVSVPLLLETEVPMAVEAKGYVTANVRFHIACALVVDHLDPEGEEETKITSHICSSPNVKVV